MIILTIIGIIASQIYVYIFMIVAILLGSVFTLCVFKREYLKYDQYLELKHDVMWLKKIQKEREEREYEKTFQPNKASHHLSEFPQIIQDMVNDVYRDDVRIDPFQPKHERLERSIKILEKQTNEISKRLDEKIKLRDIQQKR